MSSVYNIGLSFFADCINSIFFGEVCDNCDGAAIYSLLAASIRVLTIGVGILAVIGIMIVGVSYLKAAGDPAKHNKARSRLINIGIGIMVYIVLFGLAEFLLPGGVINHPISSDEETSCPEITYTDTKIKRPENPGNTSGSSTDNCGEGKSFEAKFANESYPKTSVGNSGGNIESYWINVPAGAHSGMPLVVFLHGSSESKSADSVKKLVQVKKMIERTDFISLAPVKGVSGLHSWSKDAVLGLIGKVINDYQIDSARVYIMGFSLGSQATWGIVSNSPDLFAAAAPISACYSSASKSAFSKVKLRAYVGTKDTNCNGYKTIRDFTTSVGGEFISLKGKDHGATSGAIDYGNLFDWFLSQRKQDSISSVISCPSSGSSSNSAVSTDRRSLMGSAPIITKTTKVYNTKNGGTNYTYIEARNAILYTYLHRVNGQNIILPNVVKAIERKKANSNILVISNGSLDSGPFIANGKKREPNANPTSGRLTLVTDEFGNTGYAPKKITSETLLSGGSSYTDAATGQTIQGRKIFSALNGFGPIYPKWESADPGSNRRSRQLLCVKADQTFAIITNSHDKDNGWVKEDMLGVVKENQCFSAYMLDGGASVGTAWRSSAGQAFNKDFYPGLDRGLGLYIVFTSDNNPPK